jgi:hypothetical protein
MVLSFRGSMRAHLPDEYPEIDALERIPAKAWPGLDPG